MTRHPNRRNNFDFLRIVAALMVIHGHGWVLTGGVGPGLWGVPFARVGLDVFFSISGYLITGSWQRSPHLPGFLIKRGRRIFPGLAACVLLTLFVMGPLVTRLPAAAYFTAPDTWNYLSNIALYNHLRLPGVFDTLQENGAVNGSLWSLLPEVLCYLTVPLLAGVVIRDSLRAWILAGLALFSGGFGLFLFEFNSGPSFTAYAVDIKYALVEAPFFLVGSMLALVGPRVPGLYRADLALLAFLLNYAVSSWVSWWNLPLEWFTLPYMVVCFGRLSLPLVRDAGRFGDLSFGLYLYAFPIQQLVMQVWPMAAYPVLACVALTIPMALLSWHLVEKRFLPSGQPKMTAEGMAVQAIGAE